MDERNWPAHWPTSWQVTRFRHRNRLEREAGYRGAVEEREWEEKALRAMGHPMAVPA
jgi:hypothetical protein